MNFSRNFFFLTFSGLDNFCLHCDLISVEAYFTRTPWTRLYHLGYKITSCYFEIFVKKMEAELINEPYKISIEEIEECVLEPREMSLDEIQEWALGLTDPLNDIDDSLLHIFGDFTVEDKNQLLGLQNTLMEKYDKLDELTRALLLVLRIPPTPISEISEDLGWQIEIIDSTEDISVNLDGADELTDEQKRAFQKLRHEMLQGRDNLLKELKAAEDRLSKLKRQHELLCADVGAKNSEPVYECTVSVKAQVPKKKILIPCDCLDKKD